jgi:imidazoleglycerol-phosphate dehydratase
MKRWSPRPSTSRDARFSSGKCRCPKAKLGNWDVELAEVFFEAFARTAQANLHFVLHGGHNLHHIVEISFKAFARALRQAVEIDPRAPGIPSTKGMLV